MEIQYKTSSKWKNRLRNYAIAYAILGTCYVNNICDITGHTSADLATGRSKPTKLERLYLESLGIDSSKIKINGEI